MKKIITIFVGGTISISLSVLPSIVTADPPDKVNLALQNMLMNSKQEHLIRDKEMNQKRLKLQMERAPTEQKNIQEMAREKEKITGRK
jgi:hypothetical protein